MNLTALQRANELRRDAIISGDCPILHLAADMELSRVIHEDEDRRRLERVALRVAAQRDAEICRAADEARKAGDDTQASRILEARFR